MRARCLIAFVAIALLGCQGWRRPPEPAPQPKRGLARVAATGELRVGMSGDQLPMNFKTSGGDWLGFEVAIVEVLARNLGVKAMFVERPFSRLLEALEAGDVDVVMSGMTVTTRRNRRAAFVGPYFVSGKSILTKRETLERMQENPELNRKDLRLAALASSTSEDFVAGSAPKAELTLAESLSEAVDLLLQDRVDAVVADYETCVFAHLAFPDAGLAYLDETLTVEPMGIAVPPEDTLLANLLENYLEALRLNGGLEQIRSFWFESNVWLRRVPDHRARGDATAAVVVAADPRLRHPGERRGWGGLGTPERRDSAHLRENWGLRSAPAPRTPKLLFRGIR
jgi:polar amino acid transport system substrate-binding protein